jgi:hypothetical protein
MSALSALRPGHWIAIGLIAVLVGSGTLSKGFGLLGGNTSQAQKLTTCLDHRGINVASLAAAVGNPAVLLGGAHVVDQAVKHGKLNGPEARAVMGCVQKVAR